MTIEDINHTAESQEESKKDITWNLTPEVKQELKEIMDKLRAFAKEHDLPALVIVQTENNEDSYAAEGFVHNVAHKTAGDIQMLTGLAHLDMQYADDPMVQSYMQRIADSIMILQGVLVAKEG